MTEHIILNLNYLMLLILLGCVRRRFVNKPNTDILFFMQEKGLIVELLDFYNFSSQVVSFTMIQARSKLKLSVFESVATSRWL